MGFGFVSVTCKVLVQQIHKKSNRVQLVLETSRPWTESIANVGREAASVADPLRQPRRCQLSGGISLV